MTTAGVRGRVRLFSILTLVMAIAGVPSAARADIVLHDGGVNKDRDAAQRVTERTGTAPTLVLSNDVLSGPTRVLTGHATIEQCEGAPIPLDIERKLNEIEDSVFSYELEKAVRSLDILATLAPCASAPIEASALARMSFLRGATLLDMGDPLAENAMAESLGFLPDYGGERGFPRAHTDMLDAARRRIETLPDGRMFIWAGPGAEAVFVNGIQRSQEHSAGVVVRPGLHLLQVYKDGAMKGMWVRIRSRFSAIVFPGAGRAVWADAGRSPGGEQAISLMLAAEFRGQQGDIHVLHYRGRLVSASTWPALGEGHKRWEATSSSDRRKARKRNKARKGKAARASAQDSAVAQKATSQEPSPASGDDSATAAATGTQSEPSTSRGSSQTSRTENKKKSPPRQGNRATTKAKKTPSKTSTDTQQSTKAQVQPSTKQSSSPGSGSQDIRGTMTSSPRAKTFEQRRFRLAVGGGFHYADPFSYAVLALDVTYQFFGPLHAVIFLRPSIGAVAEFPVEEGQEPIIGPVGFAPIGGGIGVQRLGRFAPYARIVGQYAHNRDALSNPEHLGGVMIQGGLDFTPKPSIPLLIRVQAEAGFLGAHFNGRLWGGVGINL